LHARRGGGGDEGRYRIVAGEHGNLCPRHNTTTHRIPQGKPGKEKRGRGLPERGCCPEHPSRRAKGRGPKRKNRDIGIGAGSVLAQKGLLPKNEENSGGKAPLKNARSPFQFEISTSTGVRSASGGTPLIKRENLSKKKAGSPLSNHHRKKESSRLSKGENGTGR